MSADKIIVIILGLLGIGFTFWFFLMRKEKEIEIEGEVDIIVEGGYKPEVISIPKGKPTKIDFLRKDQSSCLEEVILSEFKIKKYLPLNQKVTIELNPQNKGTFQFSCGMNMFHGKIIVT